MLLNNFFFIDQLQVEDNNCIANIRIEASHPILKGHFPQQPVVPGVCMLEMQKEILQSALGSSFMLSSASIVKFLTMFTPDQTTTAQYTIQFQHMEHGIEVTSTLTHGEQVFLKFKGVYFIRP